MDVSVTFRQAKLWVALAEAGGELLDEALQVGAAVVRRVRVREEAAQRVRQELILEVLQRHQFLQYVASATFQRGEMKFCTTVALYKLTRPVVSIMCFYSLTKLHAPSVQELASILPVDTTRTMQEFSDLQ